MSFNWIDYFKQAQALQCDPESPDLGNLEEASFRSAQSRAYYAAFHSALDFASGEGAHFGSEHGEVWRYFKHFKPLNKTRQSIGLDLDRLYDFRRDADYKASVRGTPRLQAQVAIGLAENILRNLDSLRDSEE